MEINTNEIQSKAREIDPSIILFEGYSPKNTDNIKGEILFWRKIVSIYGLFADCDRFQIKKKDSNLFELMCRYDLISAEEYETVLRFWNDISAIRKWFCHNNDISLYYQKRNAIYVEKFLDKAYAIASDKPKTIDEIKPGDWSIVNGNIDRRIAEYIAILQKGLDNWSNSVDKEEIIGKWKELLAKSLFEDEELISNIIIEIAKYEMLDLGITNISVPSYEKTIRSRLEQSMFSVDSVMDAINSISKTITKKELLFLAIRKAINSDN